MGHSENTTFSCSEVQPLSPWASLFIVFRHLRHPCRVDVEDRPHFPWLRLGARHLAPGGDVAVADRKRGAHAAVLAAAGKVEEPAPDVGGQARRFGDGGQLLGGVDIALRRQAFEVDAQRQAIVQPGAQLELALGVEGQVAAEAFIKFSRAPDCSATWSAMCWLLVMSWRASSGV